MRILCPGLEREKSAGGGSTFLANLSKAMLPFGHQCVAVGEYDVLLIAGASLCERDVVERAKQKNIPIILRVDNLLEDRKNKGGSGMNRMREFAAAADVVVYQSEWAKFFLGDLLKRPDGMVIKNGVDTDIFYPNQERKMKVHTDEHIFIYSKYSRGEGKHFEVVQQWWREHSIKRPQDTLLLCGRFADEYFHAAHKFEFHNGEKFVYLGIANSQEEMAEWLRLADCAVLPYFSDACSNTVLEAQACGLYTLYDHSGGTPEIIRNGEELRMDFMNDRYELINKINWGNKKFDFETYREFNGLSYMGTKYDALLQMLFVPEVEI